jgi:hypothetical protein
MPETSVGNDMTLTAPPVGGRLDLAVHPLDRLVLDSVRASLLRERDLEQRAASHLGDVRFVKIDLNGIRSLEVQPAFELVGKFVAQVRTSWGIHGAPPVVAITANNLDILRTVHAALRGSRNAAYGLLPDGRAEPLVPIGYLSQPDVQDLERLRGVEARLAETVVPQMRLHDLYMRGLLTREGTYYRRPTAEDFTS